MRTLLPVLILFIGFTSAPRFAFAERGFWKLEQLPPGTEKIKAAAESVFLITVPRGRKLTIDLEKYPTVDQAIASVDKPQDLLPGELTLRKRVIGRCFQHQQKSCNVLSSFELGTVSLIQRNDLVFGALHVFIDTIQNTPHVPLDIVLQNRSGEIVFGDLKDDLASVEQVYKDAYDLSRPKLTLTDFIGLKLTRKLKSYRPLKVNFSETTKADDVIFHIGFPAPTYDRQTILGKPDSDGTSQYVTYGSIVQSEAYLRRTGKDLSKISKDVIQTLNQAHLYTDADSTVGMSGGPTLNKNGEVIGILFAGFPIDHSASDITTVASTKFPWIQLVFTKGDEP